ncbi:MAG: DUF4105 domain-containing protein [Bacteriovorax sp.]
MKIKTFIVFINLIIAHSLMAHDLPVKLSQKLDAKNQAIINKALDEVSEYLPAKLKAGLPAGIELRFEKFSGHKKIPEDICSRSDKDKKPFVYGEYNHLKNRLTLNIAVFRELAIGQADSQKIACQHKSLYGQAIATIVHELVHAYDFNNNNPSSSEEFRYRAGFKKGLLKTKNKNSEPMRSADAYELSSVTESFAVNSEYFSMDPEFACRKPAMFDYLKKIFEADPFPNRSCQLSNIVMMSTPAGYFPMKLDPQRVYRIDYLMASPGRELSSGFGHSMFRIVLCAPERMDVISNKMIKATPWGPKCLEDRLYHMVVSYRANVEDATLNYFKGILGGYPSMLFILNFADVLDEYNRDELRDVVSYPLKLNTKEKTDFINKVLEEHWNYRGSYKFVTNNCAVESFDLLKSALDRSGYSDVHSVTPRGVLQDLDQLEFLSLKSGAQESFKAKTDQLILAYKSAYGGSENKKAVLNFIKGSSSDERLGKFNQFAKIKIESQDLHTEMSLIKSSLVKASSFSVMEQQILRTRTSEFRKKAAELFMDYKSGKNDDAKSERIKKLMEESDIAFKQNFSDLASTGYGVPLINEMQNRTEMEQKIEQSKDSIANIEAAIKELMPAEVAVLKAISSNISLFNQKSLAIRKIYRSKLEHYIREVLLNLSREDSSRTLLIHSLSSSEGLNKVRELMDRDLVGEQEILDSKLRKLIEEILN